MEKTTENPCDNTMNSEVDEELLENHRILNDLVHEINAQLNQIPRA